MALCNANLSRTPSWSLGLEFETYALLKTAIATLVRKLSHPKASHCNFINFATKSKK